MKRFVCLTFVLAVLLCGSMAVTLQAQQVSGAIFTTRSDGSAVNANHFDSKCAVYLDGGPGPNAPAKAAGLPNGEYYFQVTDPSGKTLLSTDVVENRRFRVDKGVIVAYTGTVGPVHPVGEDRDHSELAAITIGLANVTCGADFLDSPNNGGAYKVWATPVGDFAGDPTLVDNECGNGCFHGFLPSKSKTDNFKAMIGAEKICATIGKELLDNNGDIGPGLNWPIDVTDPVGVKNRYYTDAAGQVQLCGLTAGNYIVEEILLPGSMVVALIVDDEGQSVQPIYSFTWVAGKLPPVITFRNGSLQ